MFSKKAKRIDEIWWIFDVNLRRGFRQFLWPSWKTYLLMQLLIQRSNRFVYSGRREKTGQNYLAGQDLS